MRKRLTAALLCLCLLFTLLPATAFAEGEADSGTPPAGRALCEHHPQHDESCGYAEGTEGSPCTHEHDEACYTLVTECVHEHTAECYPAESMLENTATPSEPEEAEPTACTHVCSEESGCITKALDCKHEHDEACGYVPATEGTPCAFVCEICNAQDSGDPATPSDAQPEECTCETLCTEEEINADCPICSAEGAELDKVCVGIAPVLPVTALYVKQEGPSFYLSAETISSASVGGNLVANSGKDIQLKRNKNQYVEVKAYSDGGTTQYGTSLLFKCLSATRGEKYVVACVLTDGDGNVKYYGKLADCPDSPSDLGDVYVPLDGVAEGTYTLSIFSHNTDTNEISEPSPTMTVTVVGSIGFVSNYEGGTYIEIVIPPNPGPTFTQHPQDQIVEENGSATFTAEADGTDIDYYWQAQPKSSDPDTGTWYDILSYVEGGASPQYRGQSLSLSNVSGTWKDNRYTLDGGSGFDPADARFRCRAYNPHVYSDSFSNPAELTVIPSGGTDGREVELRTNSTHIQWRYAGDGDGAWRDLVALDAITGEAGTDGKEIQLQVANGSIQWKYDIDTGWTNLLALSDLQGQDGDDGREIELRNNGTAIQWRYVGETDTEWKDLVDLSAITGSDGQDGTDGADGREVELRVDGGYIQWKYDTDPDTEWENLIAVSALQGLKGDKGDKGDRGDPGADGETPYIGENGNWWIGNTDTGIKATGSDGADGSDGKDGQDGKDGKDGEDGKDGLTPYIGSNGNWWIGNTDTGIQATGTNGANGKDGINGKDGADGKNGADGQDGVGIADIAINEAGELVVTLTDGTEKNLGKVTGDDGVGIAGVSINDSGELIVTLTDGTELNAGAVPTGEAGDSGLRTIVYVSLGTAGVSLAGLIAVLAFLFSKRKMLIGK